MTDINLASLVRKLINNETAAVRKEDRVEEDFMKESVKYLTSQEKVVRNLEVMWEGIEDNGDRSIGGMELRIQV